MITQYLHNVMHYIHLHPHTGIIAAFLISFAESLAIVGTIIPGSVTMTAIGILVGTSVIPAGITLSAVILGAFCGDMLSYWAGVYYKDNARNIWPFTRWPSLLDQGEKFFDKHGGKSIIIGRFVGPVRSMIPMIAGILNLPTLRFVLAAIPSAIAWSIAYMTPGILLGALSLELPPKVATEFILVGLIIIALIWGIIWLMQHFFKQMSQAIDNVLSRIWQSLKKYNKPHWLFTLLHNPNSPEDHYQFGLVCFSVITALLFLIVTVSVMSQGALIKLNQPIYHLFRTLRNSPLDNVMLCFTFLGDKVVLLFTSALLFGWMLGKKYWRLATHWLLTMIFAAGSIGVIKHIVKFIRPQGLLHVRNGFSYPSGHTTLGVIFFGLLAMVTAKSLKQEQKWLPYATAIFIISIIALSRMYLGAHWLTDVIGSFLLGTTWLLIAAWSYRRKPGSKVETNAFLIVALSCLLLAALGFGLRNFKKDKLNYTPVWPTTIVNFQNWWSGKSNQLPVYRSNRLGKITQPFNLQWLGSLNNIKTQLLKRGWKDHPPHMNFEGALHRWSNRGKHPLPLFPLLYQNHSPVLLMTKKPSLVIRLWTTRIHINGAKQTFYLGTVNYHLPAHHMITMHLHHHPYFKSATNTFTSDLQNFKWKKSHAEKALLLSAGQRLDWDGTILLISPPGR